MCTCADEAVSFPPWSSTTMRHAIVSGRGDNLHGGVHSVPGKLRQAGVLQSEFDLAFLSGDEAAVLVEQRRNDPQFLNVPRL